MTFVRSERRSMKGKLNLIPGCRNFIQRALNRIETYTVIYEDMRTSTLHIQLKIRRYKYC